MDIQGVSEERQNVSLEDKFGNKGSTIFRATTEAEISKIVRQADKEGKSIAIESGGTKRGYGGVKNDYDITLSLKNYKGVVEHNVGDMTVTVRPGTTITELQDFLREHNQMVSIDPNWPDQATIGGVIATNESGSKRLKYGSARDLVIGLRLVYANGEIIRTGAKVVKNVAGYDMNKLFIGAMGTLGVITEITMKLRPLPKFESLVQVSLPAEKIDALKTFAIAIQDSMLEPVSLELMNPVLSKKLTGREEYRLLIAFEDVEKAVRYQEDWVENHKPEGADLEVHRNEEAQEFWRTFSALAPNSLTDDQNEKTQAILKVGSKNIDVFEIMKELSSLQSSSVTIEGHGGMGHGISQYTLSGTHEGVVAAIEEIRKIAESKKGYTIGTHLPFELRKQVDAWGGKTSSFFLFEGIKKKVDPRNTLNHQRFIGGI
ncbi:FAD-binding oxidoreductase [Halobacillus sp. BBL2006]|uniref:FAD-binding oxidoreductase n=1 Tax=Halobacillus sp. BBL2006 TaxID=1543706 RepID=UPI0005434205|nr:FAD-binding oxidoreductase [Halobacillus sp. BBL2006]KHE68387.1 lactate dehydrogenase [Halobacillus sp. BBL2006]